MDLLISIGNSDDKLTQDEWADYWDDINDVVLSYVHIEGFEGKVFGVWQSDPKGRYQNASWSIRIDDNVVEELTTDLNRCRLRYRQESIAVSRCFTILLSNEDTDLDFTPLIEAAV